MFWICPILKSALSKERRGKAFVFVHRYAKWHKKAKAQKSRVGKVNFVVEMKSFEGKVSLTGDSPCALFVWLHHIRAEIAATILNPRPKFKLGLAKHWPS